MEKQSITIDMDGIKAVLNYNPGDFLQAAAKEQCMFPAPEMLTDEYISMRQIYQYIFSQIVLIVTGLERLDRRFADREYLPGDKDKRGFYQKYDHLGLDYIFIRGNARVERLEAKEQDLIKACIADLKESRESQEHINALIDLVYGSYMKVMAVEPDKPIQKFEPVRTVHGDYRIFGNAVMFVIRSVPDFDENKNIRDLQKEVVREQNYFSVAPQLEAILTRALEMPVKVVAELL